MKEVETKQTALKNKPIYLILRTLGKDTGVAKASGWGSSRAEHRESGGAGNMKQGEWSCWEYEAWRVEELGIGSRASPTAPPTEHLRSRGRPLVGDAQHL